MGGDKEGFRRGGTRRSKERGKRQGGIQREKQHRKKRLATFPSPAWMSLTKLSLAGNNLITNHSEGGIHRGETKNDIEGHGGKHRVQTGGR